MLRIFCLTAVLSLSSLLAWGAEEPTQGEIARINEAEKEAIADPNSEKKILEFIDAHKSVTARLGDIDPATVPVTYQAQIDSLNRLKPTDKGASELLSEGINDCQEHIRNFRASLTDLEKLLDANPEDSGVLNAFCTRSRWLIEKLSQSDPGKATQIMDALKIRIVKVSEQCKSREMQEEVRVHASFMPRVEQRFIAARKQGILLQKTAPPLEVESWVNGEPVALKDLKGKVVLLDFWAVWCGPCIKSFPKLRKWQEKYADKGLVVIGVTRSCSFSFDETTGLAALKEGEESPPDEPELLRKFARHHQLTYPLAIEKQGSNQNEAYACAAIPQVVLIRRDGTIKLIKVGGSETTAKEIEAELEKLIKE